MLWLKKIKNESLSLTVIKDRDTHIEELQVQHVYCDDEYRNMLAGYRSGTKVPCDVYRRS